MSPLSRGIDRIAVTFDEPNVVANAGLLLVSPWSAWPCPSRSRTRRPARIHRRAVESGIGGMVLALGGIAIASGLF